AMVLLTGWVSMPSPAKAAAAQPGPAQLPAFTLKDIDGKDWSSSQFKGQALLVDFWATWCAACKETIPKLAELNDKYKGKGLTIIGISVDKGSAEKISKAAKRLGINYLVLLDKENSLGKSFGFSGIPSLYIFDKSGALKTAMPGYDPGQEDALAAAVEKASK
ncbi:MAG: TlpA disulfide reductase family protein, partial [Fibrobacteria bacterium]